MISNSDAVFGTLRWVFRTVKRVLKFLSADWISYSHYNRIGLSRIPDTKVFVERSYTLNSHRRQNGPKRETRLSTTQHRLPRLYQDPTPQSKVKLKLRFTLTLSRIAPTQNPQSRTVANRPC